MELSLQSAGTRAKARRLGRALPDIGRKKRPPYSALSGVPVPNSRRWFGRALHSPFTCSYGTYLASQRGRIATSVHSLNVIQMDIPSRDTADCSWCSVDLPCLSNETLCPMMPPSDVSPRSQSPRQTAAPEGLHNCSPPKLGPLTAHQASTPPSLSVAGPPCTSQPRPPTRVSFRPGNS
jgi:hypothetical protein